MDWSEREVALTVADYFEMLLSEVEGRPYRKADHRRELMTRLDGRSASSIERKHQNISAILLESGIPPIDGYKPLGNYQHLLRETVFRFLREHPELQQSLISAGLMIPGSAPTPLADYGSIIVDPPSYSGFRLGEPPPCYEDGNHGRIDYAENDLRNRALGRLGEKFVFDLEKRNLLAAGRDDLAGRVEWAADTRGDGLGYDIVSFDTETGRERLIEVKTTNLGIYTPFYITRNELSTSDRRPEEYRLYRLFRFSRDLRLFVMNPPLERYCRLEPSVYRASFG